MDIDSLLQVEAETKVDGAALAKSLEAEVEKVAKLDERLFKGEELLKQLKKDRHYLISKVIPQLLQSYGGKSFTTNSGIVCKLATNVAGSLPKEPERRKDALTYLETIDGAEIIKNEVSVLFSKGDDVQANSLFEELSRDYNGVTQEKSVHAQTLCAFVREKLKLGEAVDTAKLGVFVETVAKIGAEK
jgi:hypothetical protein